MKNKKNGLFKNKKNGLLSLCSLFKSLKIVIVLPLGTSMCWDAPECSRSVRLHVHVKMLLLFSQVSCGPKPGGGGGALPYIGYIGMCHCEG